MPTLLRPPFGPSRSRKTTRAVAPPRNPLTFVEGSKGSESFDIGTACSAPGAKRRLRHPRSWLLAVRPPNARNGRNPVDVAVGRHGGSSLALAGRDKFPGHVYSYHRRRVHARQRPRGRDPTVRVGCRARAHASDRQSELSHRRNRNRRSTVGGASGRRCVLECGGRSAGGARCFGPVRSVHRSSDRTGVDPSGVASSRIRGVGRAPVPRARVPESSARTRRDDGRPERSWAGVVAREVRVCARRRLRRATIRRMGSRSTA